VKDVVSFDDARAIADAVLLEGYLLYPYRASAQKNQVRWQFGVLNPRPASEAGSGEPWFAQTEVLVDAGGDPVLRIMARFLQVQARTVEAAGAAGEFRPVTSLVVDGTELTCWDEGVERSTEVTVPLLAAGGELEVPFTIPAGVDLEEVTDRDGALAGRFRRERWALDGVIRVAVEPVEGPYPLFKLRVRVENRTDWADLTDRGETLRRSLIAAHTLLGVADGSFVSLLEPPEWAAPAVARCENVRTWPVLVGHGRHDVLLSSPIILYDYPTIAPESPGDLFDGTEIDEILTLRTMALTEEEKREARATDPRAAALVDRVDGLPPEVLDRLHGAVRYLRGVQSPQPAGKPWETSADTFMPQAPWWDPGADQSVSPETDHVPINGVPVAKGSRVRLKPGLRRADAQDMFLTGRTAVVEAVLFDVDDGTHIAVTLENDPAAELQQRVGRFLYFAPDELEPLVDEQLEGAGP
jgi:hypothetical protein